jgi:hypothetical protein
MRCGIDATERPKPLDDDWLNDREWGWVHNLVGWHTVTGTRLWRLQDGSLVAEPPHVEPPEMPVVPDPEFVDFVGHPGLPSHAVTLDDWKRTQ